MLVAGVALYFFTGINPLNFLSQAPTTTAQAPIENNQQADFVAVVLADTESYWQAQFEQQKLSYQLPTLVLFEGRVDSHCGSASSAVGPFYCPVDRQIYLDLSFFQTLKQQLGAGGDFAQAYVIAHEVAHHVQNLLGISVQVQQQQSQQPEKANQLSVKLELQADCMAGMWANYAQSKGWLEVGDIEEAMTAAQAIGDDRLQQQAGKAVRPEQFTHGTSAQRTHWFNLGLTQASLEACNTFAPQ
ncbi:metallopeptidase [Paraferrimonas sedimenticola]|uniref:Metallopeptidase n=2 Tax=Paraferrimonas sedimenticola TaxID=375674 RepID=A0AA37W2G7_9GAMM|nr:metallopeptidase [Paraferrimonas sedimenticola]